jgi:predicted nucleic acid-binding protein
VRYWDSSALVPLLVVEEASQRVVRLLADDAAIATWWGTTLECTSAIARRERDGSMERAESARATRRLDALEAGLVEVPPTTRLREVARRLLRVHDLGAADALQVAAAMELAGTHETALAFVTLDVRLALAAEREGFVVPRL